jgi:hypothetical protein
MDLDMRWYHWLGRSYADVGADMRKNAIGHQSLLHAPLRQLLSVEVALLDVLQDPPVLVLQPGDADFFRFAQDQGLLDLGRPMVLDPLHRDFHTGQMEAALRAIGGATGGKQK